MSEIVKVPLLPGGTPRCQAMSRQTGEQCKRGVPAGMRVCRYHGGGAPQVKRAAALRLLELTDPAVATLAHVMVDPASSNAEKLRAAEAILDRSGFGKSVSLDVDTSREALLARLLALRAGELEA